MTVFIFPLRTAEKSSKLVGCLAACLSTCYLFDLLGCPTCQLFESANKRIATLISKGESPMITMLGSPRRCCDGLTRRETLQAGALAILGGMNLPTLLRAEESRAARQSHHRPGKAKSVILLYLL